jgi:hypothetical protein
MSAQIMTFGPRAAARPRQPGETVEYLGEVVFLSKRDETPPKLERDRGESKQLSKEQLAGLMNDVARELLGAPNRKLSSGKVMRYGTRGSLAVDLTKGTWYDHEMGQGGGVLAFIERETGREDPFEWLKEKGFANHQSTSNKSKLGKIVARFPYTDETGKFLFEVVKYDPKDFRQRRPDGNGGWIWKLDSVRRVPYRLPELIKDVKAGHMILHPEGEKDVENLRKLGYAATCNPMGAGYWRSELNEHFKGAHVVVIADNDPQKTHPKTGQLMFHDDGRPVFAGQDHAREVAAELSKVVQRVQLLDLGKAWPECPPRGDISDYLANHSREELDALIASIPDFEVPKQTRPKTNGGEAPVEIGKQPKTDGGEAVAASSDAPMFSEEAIALAFAERHANGLRYVAKWNQWFIWDGTCWREDEKREVFNRARDICRDRMHCQQAERSQADRQREDASSRHEPGG